MALDSTGAILKAALPRSRIRLRDALQGTMIGVLMSSTLPARLGEPSRALVVARRTGRPRHQSALPDRRKALPDHESTSPRPRTARPA